MWLMDVRKASIPVKAGGMSDLELRRYNRPNNGALADDPVYNAFPELRRKMESRTMTSKEYDSALERYNRERIELLLRRQAIYMREKREEMFERSRQSRPQFILTDDNPWVHPTPGQRLASGYNAH